MALSKESSIDERDEMFGDSALRSIDSTFQNADIVQSESASKPEFTKIKII